MIIQLEEAIHHLEDIRADVKELGSTLHIEELERELENLEAQTSEGDFWNDAKRSAKILKEIKARKSTVEDFRKLESDVEDTITLAEMGIEEKDESICEEVLAEVERIEKEEDRIRHVDTCNAQTGPIFLAYKKNELLQKANMELYLRTGVKSENTDDLSGVEEKKGEDFSMLFDERGELK